MGLPKEMKEISYFDLAELKKEIKGNKKRKGELRYASC